MFIMMAPLCHSMAGFKYSEYNVLFPNITVPYSLADEQGLVVQN